MEFGRAARELREEGYGQGRAEGYGQGRAEGYGQGLARLLQHRFNGDLTPAHRQRIAGASVEQIDIWFDRGINAPDIDAVFKK